MPPSLEQFSYRTTNLPLGDLGDLNRQEIPCEVLIATRPFLNGERLNGKRRKNSRSRPEVIVYEGESFTIDGHHKSRKAIEEGEETIEARVLTTENERVGVKLRRISQGLIKDLPIRE
jgi:hypothetical protein